MSKLDEFNEIMNRYRNGEFGKQSLSMYDILEKAGKPNLLEELSSEEKEELRSKSFGMVKMLFN